jgi:hypothetical protein
MPIRDLLLEIAAQWPFYAPKKTTDSKSPAYVLVTQTLPGTLKGLLGPSSSLKVEGSTGAGNITAAPWTGVFDPRLTSGATNGYYIVYLFAVDMQSVTLTIAFGTTQFETQFGGPKAAFPRMREAVGRLQGLFGDLVPPRYSRDPIDLRASRKHKLHYAYQQAAIFSLPPYQLAALPPEAVLVADFLETVRLYGLIVEDPIRPEVEQLLQSSIPDPGPPSTIEVTAFVPRPAAKVRANGSKAGTRRRYSAESRKVGDAGEKVVMLHEEQKLLKLGLGALVPKIVHHAAQGEFPGWDITSYDTDGKAIYIEVKASIGKVISTVDITVNEWAAAQHEQHKDRYHLYFVTEALSKTPRIEILKAPYAFVSSGELALEPSVFQLDLRKQPITPTARVVANQIIMISE